MSKVFVLALAVLACSSSPKQQPENPDMPKKKTPVGSDAVVKPTPTEKAPPDDPFLWLEEVKSEKALAWARERNKQSQAELEAHPSFAKTRDRIRAILDSKDKTPYVTKRGKFYYNFWQDEKNPRGLLRRTSLAEY